MLQSRKQCYEDSGGERVIKAPNEPHAKLSRTRLGAPLSHELVYFNRTGERQYFERIWKHVHVIWASLF